MHGSRFPLCICTDMAAVEGRSLPVYIYGMIMVESYHISIPVFFPPPFFWEFFSKYSGNFIQRVCACMASTAIIIILHDF